MNPYLVIRDDKMENYVVGRHSSNPANDLITARFSIMNLFDLVVPENPRRREAFTSEF